MSDKTYILVDGENLLFRYQAMLDAGRTPSAGSARRWEICLV